MSVGFVRAATEGDLEGLVAALDPDARFRSDGGGVVPAARKPLVGAERVARTVMAMAGHYAGNFDARVVNVNGAPGVLVDQRGELTVIAFSLDGRRIRAIDVIRNPEKLAQVRASMP